MHAPCLEASIAIQSLLSVSVMMSNDNFFIYEWMCSCYQYIHNTLVHYLSPVESWRQLPMGWAELLAATLCLLMMWTYSPAVCKHSGRTPRYSTHNHWTQESAWEWAVWVIACNSVKFKTDRNLPPLLKIVNLWELTRSSLWFTFSWLLINWSVMPAYAPMLEGTYFVWDYASIICQCLVVSRLVPSLISLLWVPRYVYPCVVYRARLSLTVQKSERGSSRCY